MAALKTEIEVEYSFGYCCNNYNWRCVPTLNEAYEKAYRKAPFEGWLNIRDTGVSYRDELDVSDLISEELEGVDGAVMPRIYQVPARLRYLMLDAFRR